jgi:hypothetical protein
VKPTRDTTFTQGLIISGNCSALSPASGSTTRQGMSFIEHARTKAAPVLPAEAITRMRLLSLGRRDSTVHASRSLNVVVWSSAPFSGQ